MFSMDEKMQELIFEYFKVEYADLKLTKGMNRDIREFFLDAAKKNLSGLVIGQILRGSLIEKYRDEIVSVHPSNYNFYPIKLGGLKPKLQMQAFEKDITLHRHLLMILRKHITS